LMSSLWTFMIPLIAVLIALIAVWRIWSTAKERKEGFPLKDERTQRIQGKAASHAIMVGSYFMILINFYTIIGTEFTGWPQVDGMMALNASIIVLNVAYLALQRYYSGREDLD
jgi:uncharacterized membrane protein